MVKRPLHSHVRPLVELKNSSARCNLCEVLWRLLGQRLSTSGSPHVQLCRKGARIVCQSAGETRRALSVCQMPRESLEPNYADLTAANTNTPEAGIHPGDVQVSLPQLLEVGSEAHAGLLREWLRDCDENHGTSCSPPDGGQSHLPTRLLDIGTKSNPYVRLVECVDLCKKYPGNPKFVALSYPWGDKTIHQHARTTTTNYEQHKRDISLNSLPALLQHAVQVTRDIGLEYLWVDALCIIQGQGGDFNTEAERMEHVFSAAYCVIAASRARGVSDGMLGSRQQRKTVTMPEQSIFLCEDIDDFQQDVIDGHLNKRGWVLQERALARRTIYFAERQTYWECGKGIRCETFTKMNKYVQKGSRRY